MNFLKKLFGSSNENSEPKKEEKKHTLQDLFFTTFSEVEAGEFELSTKEFELFDKLKVIKWAEYPNNKNLIFTGNYSKQRVEKVAKVVNSLVYFYGKDVQNNGNFNDNDQHDLLDKGNGDLDGWWIGRQWDSTKCTAMWLPTPNLSREGDKISLLLSF